MVWEFHDKHPSTSIGKIVRRHIGSADAGNVDRMVSAYEALLDGKFKSAEDVRAAFTRDGKPLFTPEQAASVYRKVGINQKKGGAEVEPVKSESILDDTVQKMLDVATGTAPPSASIPPKASQAINEFVKTVQMVLRMILPFVFILNTLENSPLFGDLIGASLDVTAAALPVVAATFDTVTPIVVGAFPVPEAGEVGILLGWLFSLFFLWLAAVIALSRKNFAGALEATAGMIPGVGLAAMRAVKSVETVGTKFYNRSERIVQSISNAYGSLKGAIDKVKSSPLVQTAISNASNPQNTVKSSPLVQTANSKASNLQNTVTSDPRFQTLKSKVTGTVPPPVQPSVGGRFTRRRRNINKKKWKRKTTRRRQ